MMQAVRAVTFDAAGTLIETSEPVSTVYARFAREHDILVNTADLEKKFREAFATTLPLAFGNAPLREREARERDWWKSLVSQAFGKLASHQNFDTMFDALYHYYALGEAWRLREGAREVVLALRRSQIKTAVMSNFDSRLESVLTALDFAPYFDAVVYSTLAGAAKPDPRIFNLTLKQIDVDASCALHVGDNRHADYDGAMAIGMRALLIETKSRSRHAHSIERLSEVLDFV